MLILPADYQLLHHEQLDSTNEEGKRLIHSGLARHKHIIVADTQVSGRGRNTRQWISEYGNLYLTILHELNSKNNADLESHILATSLAVRQTVASYVKKECIVQWNWPNDVLVENKKISGILLEKLENKDRHWLIIGVGVNILHAPDIRDHWPATCLLAHANGEVDREDVLKTFVNSFHSYYNRVQNGEMAALIEECLLHAAQLHKPIHVHLPDKTLYGVFEGMDSHGNLLLLTDNGLCRISAGDIFFVKEDVISN
jgi:BirA family biotin operon repressor/biotin-[acetyl-CoA-carboxylase] ligase